MSEATSIERVGICGSGIMGAGILQVAAAAGFETTLRSRSASSAEGARAIVEANLDRAVAKERMTAEERDAVLARVHVTDDLSELAECDLVVESVVEDLAVKRALFVDLDAKVGPDAVLATNTSTLPVVELAAATGRPQQVCGIHFFNPAPAMSLVEIVRPLTASDDTIEAATSFARICGKDPVQVADEAGFVVNALLFPYLNNAVKLLERGTADREGIDAAMQGGCGFPMGPLALLDLVGLDTSLSILDALRDEFGTSDTVAAPTLRRLVAAGHLGRKTGRGFYDY